jgi:hypothetical protein
MIVMAFMTWGNLIAVGHRFRMEFYRFASGGSPIDALAGIFFGCLPGAIAMRLYGWGYWGVVATIFVVYCLMFWFSLIWSGRKFERTQM